MLRSSGSAFALFPARQTLPLADGRQAEMRVMVGELQAAGKRAKAEPLDLSKPLDLSRPKGPR